MSLDTQEQLQAVKDLLGRRRYRVGILVLGRGLAPNLVARRLRVSQRTVYRDLAVIERLGNQSRDRITQRHRLRGLHAALAVSSPN